MKKPLAAAVLSLATLAPIALTVEPASADTANCVHKEEFQRVKRDFSMKRVHDIFDVRGSQTYFQFGDPSIDWPDYQTREYRPCSRYSYVSVSYERYPGDKWRVVSKTAYWF